MVKDPVKKTSVEHAKAAAHAAPKVRYYEGIGRRKTAIARARVFYDKKISKHVDVSVNDRKFEDYFPLERLRGMVKAPLHMTDTYSHISLKIEGGGPSAQAEAARLAIARALLLINPEWRAKLKAASFLKRDPRMVERKKYGSRKARRPQQWRKR
jgi:small subunit ribosomal protein S9